MKIHTLAAASASVQKLLPNTKQIGSLHAISQNGTYTTLLGIKPESDRSALATFAIAIANNTLVGQTTKSIELIETVLAENLARTLEDRFVFAGLRTAVFEGGALYIYVVELQKKISLVEFGMEAEKW